MIHNRERRHTISSSNSRSAIYASIANDYYDAGFKPIPVKGKTPVPAGATGRAGTVTDYKVADWASDPEWMRENLALRAEGFIAIDVDQYGDKHGADQIATLESALGELPATITSTARGPETPSRQHFYRVPAGMEFITKPGDDIEIVQRHHRYSVVAPSIHPDSGQPYVWYGYDEQPLDGIPSLGDFEELPAAWLEHLTAEPVTEHDGFSGDIDAWLATTEPGAPTSRMLHLIGSIPAEDFGHDRMLALAFKIVRLGAEGYSGISEGLTALYAAWLRGAYNTPDNLRGINIAVQGAIKKAGAREATAPALEIVAPPTPEDSFPPLLPFLTVANLLPDNTSTGQPFSTLYMDEPDVKTDGTFAAQRRTLASEALTAGLDDLQTASLVWGAVVGKPLQSAPNGLRTLWAEVTEAAPTTQHLATVTPIRPITTDKPLTVDLLTDAERLFVDGYVWFGTRYLDWVGSKPIIVNRPYHRSNRWVALERVFGDKGVIYHPVKPVGLGLYHINLGGSSTGKTESFELVEQVISAYFAGTEERPVLADITKVSPNALHSTLIERDGKTSLVRTDEAQAFFDQVKGNEWQRGLIDDFAKYYEGRVAAKIMSNDKENSNKEADTDLIVHFTGITDLVMQNLELSNWQSGFLLRCVWAIGNPSQPRDRSTEAKTQADLAVVHEVDQFPAQFAAEFRARRADIATFSRADKHVLIFTPEAQSRHLQLANDLDDALSGHPQYTAVLKDYTTRFLVSINKCAGLVAMSEASEFVELRHELVAIEQAEEWLAAALIVLAKTGNTRFDRQCQDLLAFVTDSPRGTVPAVDVYRKFRPAAHADALLRQLECEQRITRETNTSKTPIVKIRRDEAA